MQLARKRDPPVGASDNNILAAVLELLRVSGCGLELERLVIKGEANAACLHSEEGSERGDGDRGNGGPGREQSASQGQGSDCDVVVRLDDDLLSVCTRSSAHMGALPTCHNAITRS